MIKFFRHIRKDLMENNKTGKYIKYAIGEIFLVMIGILLALQVNNWNDHRKGRIKKDKLLHALEIEFNKNLTQLDTVLKYDNIVVSSSFEFLKIKSDDSILNDRYYMRQLLQNTSWNWTFDPQNGALESGKTSGEINLIENATLSNLLFSWRDVVVDAQENEERALNTRLQGDRVLEKHIRNVDYRNTDRTEFGPSKFNSDYKALVLDPLFEDYISNRYARMLDAVKELDDVRQLNLRIIQLIKEELAKS